MNTYDNTKDFWNNIYNKEVVKDENFKMSGELEEAVKWLSEDKNKIIDFGCGSGILLIEALKNNEKARGFGTDISEKAISLAEKNAEKNNVTERVNFRCGGIEILKTIKDNRYEAVILSNIIDNITPMDCYILLDHIKKIIKKDGKLLIKVNPYMEKEEMKELGAVMLNDELFEEKEGTLLRNLTTEKWISLLEDYFELKENSDIFFEKQGVYNRLFLMVNSKK